MKHTEGPWGVRDCGAYGFEILASDGEKVLADRIDNEADARLIATAPEMAALLRELNEHFDSFFGIPTRLYVERTKSLLAELEEHE